MAPTDIVNLLMVYVDVTTLILGLAAVLFSYSILLYTKDRLRSSVFYLFLALITYSVIKLVRIIFPGYGSNWIISITIFILNIVFLVFIICSLIKFKSLITGLCGKVTTVKKKMKHD